MLKRPNCRRGTSETKQKLPIIAQKYSPDVDLKRFMHE